MLCQIQSIFPTHQPCIFKSGEHTFQPLEEIFGFINTHCRITPPDDLYFPVLPERTDKGKVLFHLTEMTGTSAEVLKAVQLV